MGIVEHYKLGEIIGEVTAGANGSRNDIALPGGFTVSLTGMRVLKHDGSQHHLVGIKPTIVAKRTIQGITEGKDEVLERAISFIHLGK
jgi:C-terminal processing protease CtpA/Prc